MAYEKQTLDKLVRNEAIASMYRHRVRANDIDIELRQNIGRKVHEFDSHQYPDPSIFFQKTNNNYVVDDARLKSITDTLKDGYSGFLGNYVSENLNEIVARIGSLDSSQLYKTMLSVNPLKTGNAAHDELVGIHKNLNDMQSWLGGKGEDGRDVQPNINEISKYILERNSISPICLEIASVIIAGNPDGSLSLLSGYIIQQQNELKKKFLTKVNGKYEYNRGKISAYLKGNIAALSDRDKIDVYGGLGRTLHSLEKQAEKKI